MHLALDWIGFVCIWFEADTSILREFTNKYFTSRNGNCARTQIRIRIYVVCIFACLKDATALWDKNKIEMGQPTHHNKPLEQKIQRKSA